MKSRTCQFRKMVGATVLLTGLFAVSGAVDAAGYLFSAVDSPGSTKGNTMAGGKFKLTISDPDGIRWYQIAASGATNPLKGYERVDGNCKTSIEIALDPRTAPHHVQFKDCSGGEDTDNDIAYAFEQRVYRNSGNNAGDKADWIDYPDDDDDDGMTVVDMNVDGIPDVVLFDRANRAVTVLIGNGDGSLQDPMIGADRVIILPSN